MRQQDALADTRKPSTPGTLEFCAGSVVGRYDLVLAWPVTRGRIEGHNMIMDVITLMVTIYITTYILTIHHIYCADLSQHTFTPITIYNVPTTQDVQSH